MGYRHINREQLYAIAKAPSPSSSPHAKVFSALMPAASSGQVAVGGVLSRDLLIEAYLEGIFPWYEDPPIRWVSPHERMVLVPTRFHASRSLRQWMKKEGRFLRHSADTAFPSVMEACAQTPRGGSPGTWINDDMLRSYNDLHEVGLAHSVEIWDRAPVPDDQERPPVLIGGLYGLLLGRMFFGESMFSHRSNTSKLALWLVCCFLAKQGIGLIDCQVVNPHLASLGACIIDKVPFVRILRRLQNATTRQGAWSACWRELLGEHARLESLFF